MIHGSLKLSSVLTPISPSAVRYVMRPPVSFAACASPPGSHEVVYGPKAGHDEPAPTEADRTDAMAFVARVLAPRSDRSSGRERGLMNGPGGLT